MKKKFQRFGHAIGLAARIVAAVAVIALVIWKFRDLQNIDVRALVEASSGTFAAILTVLAVYLIKGITFVVPASLVYIAVGMAFPPVVALLVNFAGILIEILVSYLAGIILGGDFVTKKLEKNKYGAKILSLQNNRKNSAIFVVRVLPVFPIDLVSLFLGAIGMKLLPYILVSLAGIMPRVILFTLLGDGIYDYIPMKAVIPAAAILIAVALIIWIIRYIIKSKKAEKPAYQPLCESGNSVIFDTDMGPDCDDAGAWALLLKYAEKYKFDILGAANCTSNEYANGVIRAIAGEDVYVGQHRGKKVLPNGNKYNKAVTEKYFDNPKDACRADDDVVFYKKLLSKAEKKSVTIITVGTFSNIAAILEKEPKLFNSKVRAIVAMAGKYPEGKEFNIESDIPAAQTVLEKFENTIIFSDFEIGVEVVSGFEEEKENDPVYDCYKLYVGEEPYKRSSWDLTAVHFAVEGEGKFYDVSPAMKVSVDNEGCMHAEKYKKSNRFFIKRMVAADVLADHLENEIFR